MRNIDSSFNKKEFIEYTVEVNNEQQHLHYGACIPNKMFRRMWKAVETKIEKTRITKTERRRKEAKKRRKIKKGENNESKKMAEE